ncbi:MAG: hypothetical protein EXS64_03125 [Candidatus Latescibacteria bacterium]|nr:hypothetical protein [Candidatus Latescibacterota bacterium]
MICDSHCHLKHGNKEMTEYTGREIVEAMDGAGIDKTVVFAICVTSAQATEFALRACREFPDRLIPYAYAIPHISESALSHVERAVRDFGFRGIKVHGGETRLTPYVIDPVFELAARLDVPCLVDFAGNVDYTSRIAETFPKTTIIVAHMGRYLCTDRGLLNRFIEIAEKYENVILDTSGVVIPGKVSEAVHRIGSDRMAWGIDGPYPAPDLASFAKEEIDRIRILPISEKDKDNLFWGTISRLLKLE